MMENRRNIMTDNNFRAFSRCSVGKNKWFWVIYKDLGATGERIAEASGYTSSASEAEEQARAAIKSKYGQVAAWQRPAHYAALAYRREVAKRRVNRKSSTTDAKEIEYLYVDYEGDYTDGSVAHRIIRKTAKRVFVARYGVNSCNEDDKWEEDGQVYHDVETIALDRHQLETEGCATNKRCWFYFHTTPWEARHKPATSRCLDLLGLEGGASAERIKAAYRRLAKEHHPDRGGNGEEFKRLQEAYEMAISSAS
jgi:hypothetical protein